MNSGDNIYIWQAGDWPEWRYDLAALAGPLAEVSRAQGLLMGRLADVGLALRDQASLAALTERFGVRRSDRRFWPLSDALHAEWRRRAPGEAAVLDYSRLENN